MLAPEIIKKLQDIIGGQGVRSGPDELAAHGYDVGRDGRQIPWGMVFPSNAAQAAAVMVLAGRENLTILPQGTGTRRICPVSLIGPWSFPRPE